MEQMGVADLQQRVRRHRTTKSDTTNLNSFIVPKTDSSKSSSSSNTTPTTIVSHQLDQLKEHEAATDFFHFHPPSNIPAIQFTSSPSIDSTSSASFNSSPSQITFPLKRIPSNTQSLPSRSSPKLRNHIRLTLPEGAQLVSVEKAADLVKTCGLDESNQIDELSNLLILDARPFHDYCNSHIIGAINISLPSTLSRRPTFSLEKCIQTLTHDEKDILQKYLARDPKFYPTVLIYDNVPNTETDLSSAVYHLSRKFISYEKWNSPVYILENGYQTFEYSFANLTATGSYSSSKIVNSDADTSTSSLNDTFSPMSSQFQSPQSASSLGATSVITNGAKPAIVHNRYIRSPLTLSRFKLPDVSHMPFFKSRHNEEIMSDDPDSNLHLQVVLTPSTQEKLPEWLSNIYGNDLGATELSKKFNSLQLQERERLNNALTHRSHIKKIHSPRVSSGFELGRKNRYKDIFPYEHARVKIKPYANSTTFVNSIPVEGRNIELLSISTPPVKEEIDNDASYINASYLHYPSSKFHYIATQGPLEETVGDFWKVVYDHQVPMIISLTPQRENYVEKCAPFWEPSNYSSNGVNIKVELVEELDDADLGAHTSSGNKNKNKTLTIFRHLKVTIGTLSPLHTLQIHVSSWPDHGILINSEPLLGLVSLKSYLMDQLVERVHMEKSRPIVVHCSAGSGRTGCFCCIDTAIDQLIIHEDSNDPDSPEEGPVTPACEFARKGDDKDLIYNITSSFRTQRVAIVQNLRQYILIYDVILKYIETQKRLGKTELLTPNGTSGHFLNGDVFTSKGLIDWQFKINDTSDLEGQFINRFLKTWV